MIYQAMGTSPSQRLARGGYRKRKKKGLIDRLAKFIYGAMSDEDDDQLEKGFSRKGLFSRVLRGIVRLVAMSLNAFCAAIGTQIYNLFTGRWKRGGGPEIPVMNTIPGSGESKQESSSGGHVPYSSPSYGKSERRQESFINRYRD